MKPLSEKISVIKPSPIRSMFNKIDTGGDSVNLVLGEPSSATPDNIIQASYDAMREGYTHYTHNTGIAELRKTIADVIACDSGLTYDPDREILVTAGAQEALYLSLQVILNPGDEVLLADPYFPPYENGIRVAGGVPVLIPVSETDGFVFRPGQLENYITPKTKAILLNSPSNPTGSVADERVLEELAGIARKYDLYVISDEVYSKILYDGITYRTIASLQGMQDRTIMINSFSKAYAMTGWRIGYAACNPEIRQRMTHLQENVMACVSNPSQYAAMEAYKGSQVFVQDVLETYHARRELLVTGLNSIPGITCRYPAGAFFAFANISQTGMGSQEFSLRLYEQTRVLTVPGIGFGAAGEGFIRLSFAASQTAIHEGLNRIETYMTNSFF